MAKEKKIVSEYTVDISKAEKQLAELEAKINVMNRTNEKKWYQFWK